MRKILTDTTDHFVKDRGVIGTGKISSKIKFGSDNYTEWRKDKFDDMTAEELNNAAAEYGRLHHKD